MILLGTTSLKYYLLYNFCITCQKTKKINKTFNLKRSTRCALIVRKNTRNKRSEIFKATKEPQLQKCDHNKRFTDCLHCTTISTDCDASPHELFALHVYSPDWFLWMSVKTKSAPFVRSPCPVFTQNTVGGGIPDGLHITVRLLPSVISFQFLVNGRMDEGSEKMTN